MCNFGHLHTHTEYSTLDGMGKPDELVRTAKELGQTFISCTDHGTTSGLLDMQKAGDKYGVKIIFGNEFYYERENDGNNGHLVVLAKSDEGLRNIFRMQEISYVENFYKKPRINWKILLQHKEGLIVTSSCLGSTFNQHLMAGEVNEATEWARKFHDEFGEDFYIEIQPNSIPEQYTCNTSAIRIAEKLGIQLVATNDVHYTLENDCFPHEVLLALQMRNKMSDEKRFKFSTDDFWLKSEEEMWEGFKAYDEESIRTALANTVVIADKCNARIPKGKYLPTYHTIPEGKTEKSLLADVVHEGAVLKGFVDNEPYMTEVKGELDVIDRTGYSGYFLIVQDYVNSARRKGIITSDGRGSGAGSKVAYLSNISKIEPSEFDLLFERFMADGREPDFDVDFSDQDAVFEDLQGKYGVANVARIIAFGTLTAKAVTRKVLSAFEHPMSEVNAICKLIGEESTLEEAIKDNPDLIRIMQRYKTEFAAIQRLEGIVSHESQHAGGVIIYPNLSSILPIKSKSDERSKRIVGWDKYMLEELGHYKFDILGLEYLPIVRNTLDSILRHTGVEIDFDTLDYEDAAVYEMLQRGDVSGVFQISNQAAKVMEQKPVCFRDLIAINALIRPGCGDWDEYIARRRGKKWEVADERKSYMNETFGTITYQEQFMLDCRTYAGWTIAFADKNVRKGKDVANNLDLKTLFLNDSIARGFELAVLIPIWEEICACVGDYSFPKAHATAYARLLFQTAYLKCHYPIHFYAALMTSKGDDQDAISAYIAECKARGLQIMPPDINISTGDFVVTDVGINYRITTIKHVGDAAIKNILSLRPIDGFADFMGRRDKSQVKSNVVENLIKAGCFDFDNSHRDELMWKLDMMSITKTQIKNNFQLPKYEFNDKIKAQWERDALGMYLSSHPMEKYGFKPFDSFANDAYALVGGEIMDIRTIFDKKGNEMAFITLSTLFGTVKVTCFSSSWSRIAIRSLIAIGNVVMVKGKKNGDCVLLDSVEVLV